MKVLSFSLVRRAALWALGAGVFFAAGDAFAAGAALPSGYTRLAYIQGSGSSRILTDFTPNPQTDKVVAEVEFTATNKTATICCARGKDTQTTSWTVFLLNTGRLRADYNSTTGTEFASPTDENVRYTLTYDRNVFRWSGGADEQVHTAVDSFTAAGNPIMLFASYYNGTRNNIGNYGTHKLYSFKIYRNGTLIHDYVPCKDASGIVTLYDEMPENRSTLTRTGTFTAGPLAEFVRVAGSPVAVASPNPSYGDCNSLVKGQEYTFTCPAVYTNDAQTLGAQCLGWQLELTNGTVTTGSELTKTIVYGDETAHAKLTWRWNVDCKVTATAGAGGTVAPAEQWVRMYDVAKVVATPASGKDLWAWTGGRRAERAATFAEVCTGPMDLTAEFEDVTEVTPASGIVALGEAVNTLKAAIAAGTKTCGILSVPAGKYELQDTTVLDNRIMVKGAGRDQTLLYRKGAKDTAVGWRLFAMNHADACISDLTISNACYNAGTGAGVNIDTNGGTLLNCRVQRCWSTLWDNQGPCVYVKSDKGLVSRCIIEDGYKQQHGKHYGLGARLSKGVIENTLVRNATYSGSNAYAGGLYLDGTAVACNCTVVNNSVHYYGGVYCGSTAKALNCVVLNNKAPNDTSAGAPNWAGTAASFVSCAITPKANDTCYDGAPDFSDMVDYRLLPSSLLRDAGDVEKVGLIALGGLDLDGNPRVVDGKIDIGCYQFDVTKKAIGFAVSPTAAAAGATFVFTPSIVGYTSAATHSWTLTDAAGNVSEVPVAKEGGFVISTPGIYKVTLSVTEDSVTKDYFRTDYLYVAPTTIYVDEKAKNAVAPYDSWEKATPSLNAAVTCSQRFPGQTIVVTNGTYNLTASLEFTIATTMRSVEGAGKTTIHGKTKRPIRLDHAQALVSGFTITGGQPSAKGGGVFFDYNGGTLTDSIVTGNKSMEHDSQGGGIYMRSASAHVNRCVIENNTACRPGNANGGGAYMSDGLIENCLFTGNKCNWNGGGVFMSGGKLYNCTFYNNTSADGKTTGKQGGGIYASGGTVKNCASYGNTANNDTSACAPDAAGTASCFSNCAFPKTFNGMEAIPDAGFIDAAGGDFHLTAGSGLRDLGEDLSDLSDKDLDGNPRKSLSSAPDAGCYEYDKTQKALGLSVSPTVGYEGGSFAFTPTIEGYGAGATHFWTITDQKGVSTKFDSDRESAYPVANGGVYDVKLSVVENDVTNDYSLAKVFRVVKKVQTVSTVAELEAAADDAKVAADVEITVKPGTYLLTKTLDFPYNTRLVAEGGATNTVLKRDSKAGNFRILNLNHADAYVQGFTITGGYATDDVTGGGVHISSVGGTLVDCVVTDNHLYWYDNGGAGIGMAGGLVDRCVITNNVLDYTLYYVYGGGVRMSGGTLRNSLIAYNYAHKNGGGVYISGGKMIGCTVYGNKAAEASGWSGGGIYVAGGTVANCASYGNTAQYDTSAGAPDVAGDYTKCTNCAFPKAVGSLAAIADPRFTDAEHDDFTLATGSPLIDAGAVRDDLGDKDLAGLERRSRESAPDIGCHEYDKSQVGIGFTVAPAEAFEDTTVVFTPTIEGGEGEIVKTWELIASDGTTTVLPASCETGVTIANYSTYSVKLTVTVGGKDYSLTRESVLRVVPRTMYVDVASEHPTAPYATRETASTNIHDTVAYAIDGTTIRVAAGEYEFQRALELERDITLVSDEGAEKTVLKRTRGTKEPQFGLVRMHSSKALVKGFTITGGYGSWGGVLIDTRGGTLEDSYVVSNRCNLTQSYQDGTAGGCHSRSSRGVWRRCRVEANATYWCAAGGIQGGVADNCLVVGNYALGTYNANGGGMSVGSATNCTVVGNYSYGRTGGMVADVAYNCLMLGNVQTNAQSVGFVSDWVNDVSVRDNYRYCCTSSRTGEGYVITDYANAGFVNAEKGNYRLTKRSPAFKIGSRLNYTAASVDLDGKPRIFNFSHSKSRPDAGCYERQSSNLGGLLLIVR